MINYFRIILVHPAITVLRINGIPHINLPYLFVLTMLALKYGRDSWIFLKTASCKLYPFVANSLLENKYTSWKRQGSCNSVTGK